MSITRLGLVIILAMLITACSTTKPRPVAYQCPPVKLPSEPIEPILSLKQDSRPDEIIKAWVATATGYKAWHDTVLDQYPQSIS